MHPPAGPAAPSEPTPHDREGDDRLRETGTLALYALVTLAADLTALPSTASRTVVLGTLGATAVGLGLAHWYAYTLSTTFVRHGLHLGEIVLGLRQLATTVAIALALAIPFMLLPVPAAFTLARWEVTLGTGGVAYLIARWRGASRVTALAYAAVALLIGVSIIAIEAVLHH